MIMLRPGIIALVLALLLTGLAGRVTAFPVEPGPVFLSGRESDKTDFIDR